MKKLKEISSKLKMAFAVLFAHHVVAFYRQRNSCYKIRPWSYRGRDR